MMRSGILLVSEAVEMDLSLELYNVAFTILFLAWFLVDILRKRRDESGSLQSKQQLTRRIYATVLMVSSNVSLSLFSLGFCFYGYWKHKVFSFNDVFSAVAWVLATFIVVYSGKRTLGEERRWPLVLVLWWVCSGLLDSLLVSVYLIHNWKSKLAPDFLTKGKLRAEIVRLLLLMVICISVLFDNHGEKYPAELEQPILEKTRSPSKHIDPYTRAGIWSCLAFQWLNPLFEIGRIRKLELLNVPGIPQSETAERAFSLLEESLGKQKSEASSLTKSVYDAVWKPLSMNAVFAGVNTIASYMGPFLITSFVNFLSKDYDSSSYRYGLLLAFIFFLGKTVESLAQRQWYFGAQRIGVRIRAALTVLVYKKSLSLRYAGQSNGRVINLINVDVERVGDFLWYIHGVWLLPVQVFLALAILYKNLGAGPSMAALFATVFVMMCNTPLANRQEKLHSKIMEAKDLRIKATSETLKSIRVLKLHSWEFAFLEKVLRLRENERNWLKKYLYTCSAVAFLFWASPTLVSVVTFGVCILLKTPLTSGAVLSALATFRILQEPIYNLPELISMIAQTKVSIDRIQHFIKQEDQIKLILNHSQMSSDIAIEIERGAYSWQRTEQTSKTPTTSIMEKLKIIKGYKVAVCGSVGSGKSSFLCSILGEIPKISGAGNKVYGSKAYVPQSAWIQTGTIRENILFGRELNDAFYEDVLEKCALMRDMDMLADGDLTFIGERGINLSGGQKQRIQLARAIYSDSDIYILDDPFSAVDAHTATHLFEKCVMELLARKTVIYVTHQLEFLNASDLILVMKDGRLVQSGKYKDLIANSTGEFFRQMAGHNESLNQVKQPQQNFSNGKYHHKKEVEVIVEDMKSPISDGKASVRAHEEECETGRVKWRVYSTFLTSAFKGGLLPVILLCQVLFQGLQMGSNYWIAWATEVEYRVSREELLGIFVLLSGGSSIFILGRAMLLTAAAVETAQSLFLRMMESISRAPISFFDSTPSSRILSRSSTDQSIVDTDIPYRLAGLVFALIQLLSIIILMSHIVWQIFLLFLVIIAISIWYQAYYITTARELARMVGVRKAPILHHFSESIAGAATIRGFNQEEYFLTKNLTLVDEYSRVIFHNSATMEWLCLRINFLFNLVFFLALIALVSLPRSAIDPSLAGLAVTYGLNLNVLQAWVIWNLCNVENKMISVEKILQFSNIPSEAPLVIKDCRPALEWPTNGEIYLENLHVRYSHSLPMILKGITCTFPGEKKIGVVGRTGSGKSTLIQALFRMVEPSEGRIFIDGVDICKMGLQDLRSKLSIIPQDPTLFQGTTRTNLDPLQQHSDQEIWQVLKKCYLLDTVCRDQRFLDSPVDEDGENWSVGQRQLICLARALLQRQRILVLDEATASVDSATDNVIQKTIREETSKCTVITVAHRIPTVIDNDLVLVLDDGKVLEYDSPAKLLKDKNSAFSKMVMEYLGRSAKTD